MGGAGRMAQGAVRESIHVDATLTCAYRRGT